MENKTSNWVSAYDALPHYLRRQQGPSSVQVVVLEIVLFSSACREWAGIVEAFTVVRCSLGQRAALFPGQGVEGLDLVHGSGRLCELVQPEYAIHAAGVSAQLFLGEFFDLELPGVWDDAGPAPVAHSALVALQSDSNLFLSAAVVSKKFVVCHG